MCRRLLFYFIFLVPICANAQPSLLPSKSIVFDQLPEALGLGQSSINCILQDRDGYLWVGTWSGLLRYDGYSTTLYHTDNGKDALKSNKVTSLYEDRNGILWVGTLAGGLFSFNKTTNKFRQFLHDDGKATSLSNNSVWVIKQDAKDNLWIGTENGLNRFDHRDSTFRSYFSVDNDTTTLTNSFITDIFSSATGELWVSTQNGLNKVIFGRKEIQFRQFIYNAGDGNLNANPANHYLHNNIFGIDELKSGNRSVLWFCTIKGLKKLDHGVITNYEIDHDVPAFNYCRALKVVSGDHPYILAGAEMGLNVFDPVAERFTRFLGNDDKKTNLSHNTVTSLFIDRGGVLWVGTKKGLNKFNTFSKEFQLFLTADFDKTKSIITGICESRDAGYWISTIGGGLFKYVKGNFKHYTIETHQENSFTEFIQTLYKDSSDNLWIGTAGGGAYKISESDIGPSGVIKRYVRYKDVNPRTDSHIMAITEDSSRAIWIGSWSGALTCVTSSGKIIPYDKPQLRDFPIVALHADGRDLWIGTRGNGLWRARIAGSDLQLEHFQHRDADSLSIVNDFINCIERDHLGKIWIGTEGGLVKFDSRHQSFTVHTSEANLTNNVIVSMLEDGEGKLWLAHWNGLSVYNPKDGSILSYDAHDRIQGGFYYNNVCHKDRKGLLLFGGSNGFNIIDAKTVEQNPLQPQLVIEDFQVFNRTVPVGEVFNGRVLLNKSLNDVRRVELHYDENSISFEFSALDFAAPEKIRYAYLLEGFDQGWHYTSFARRYANYTNLKVGDYRLLVRATNPEGVWNSVPSIVDITILPPWWKTTWAGIVYFILFVFLLWVLRNLVLMRVNFVHELKVERMQRDNLEKLNKAKLQFFTNVSHEFRTPLTLILGPAQSLLDTFDGGKIVRDQLLSINNNAQRLLRLVNQLMDFRKSESGNLKLEVAEADIVKFVKEIKLSFDPLAGKLDINFSMSSSASVIVAWFDRDQFEKILFNLLSNAFKNTPAGGKVSIDVKALSGEVAIVVEDTGKGIKPEHFDNIFQSFFSYDEEHHHTGTGIGLALTKSLVEMHHGVVKVESEEHHFTRFTVTIPLGNSHFDKSEIHSDPLHDGELSENYELLTTRDGKDNELYAQTTADEDHPTLLVVEDNVEVRQYIFSIFETHYRILEAGDGRDGLDLAMEELPDLIISDVMMPVMDGINMCREIKSNVKTSHIPVVLLTARTSLIYKVEGLETGADDYVTKPFSPTVLQLKVRNILRARESMRKVFQDATALSIEPTRVTLNSSDEKFIEKVLASVEANISNSEYSVEDLADDVAMSRMQLYRKLKAVSGQSANEFIRTLRLKRAAQLLEQNELTVAEVTYEVGFSDLQYFRECFKKFFSLTPSEYIQKKLGREVPDVGQS